MEDDAVHPGEGLQLAGCWVWWSCWFFGPRKMGEKTRCQIVMWIEKTPWKINVEPENHLIEKENHLLNLHFGVQNVNFPGYNPLIRHFIVFFPIYRDVSIPSIFDLACTSSKVWVNIGDIEVDMWRWVVCGEGGGAWGGLNERGGLVWGLYYPFIWGLFHTPLWQDPY